MSVTDFESIKELEKAAKKRFLDAKSLFADQKWRGAMYLAGYNVECLLKWKLMEINGLSKVSQLRENLGLEPAQQHNLGLLMDKTDRGSALRSNRDAWFAFCNCLKWKTAWRYDPSDGTREEADDFLQAVTRVGAFITNSI